MYLRKKRKPRTETLFFLERTSDISVEVLDQNLNEKHKITTLEDEWKVKIREDQSNQRSTKKK